jgi:hypothetical protein
MTALPESGAAGSIPRADRWVLRAGWDIHDLATLLLLAALAAIVLLTFQHYAISNDEEIQQKYGELIIAYYASGLTDRALFELSNLYLYGGLFDVLVTFIAKLVPIDVYSLRHIVSALIGIGGIAAAAATARLIAGPRAGLLAAVMLTLCGVWYGAMFNHTKDIPFAAAMIGALYFLLRLTRDLPRPRWRDVVLFGLLLGAALGLRAMGLLLVGYAGAAVLLQLFARDFPDWRARFNFAGRSALALAPAMLIGYAIMVAAWPWAALAPLNPIRGLLTFANFKYEISTLFAGKSYYMGDIPREYIPAYILIKLPLIIFPGVALALVFAAVSRLARPVLSDRARWEIGFVAFAAAFPVACQVIGRGPAFTGMRHFLFVVPPLAVLAGIGFDLALTSLQRWRPAALAAAAVLVAAMIWNASVLVRLHPHQYLYYNALVGGLAGADGRYDTDYWVNIVPEAMTKLRAYLANETRSEPEPPVYFASVCGEKLPLEKVMGPRFQWTDDWDIAHFFISPTHNHCDAIMAGEVIVRIERLGALIGVVKDRRALIKSGAAKKP